MKEFILKCKIVLFVVALSNDIAMNGQQIFSKDALTGKGELLLKGDRVRLQPEVFDAFEEMRMAALADGIHIEIASGYRSFERQQLIWNDKFKNYIANGLTPNEAIEKIIVYSTVPGTSRHHWGTDIDIYEGSLKAPKNVLNPKHFEKGGMYESLKNWMDKNASKFGFYLVYIKSEKRKGFAYEPWHYSFRSLSRKMLSEFLSLNFKEIFAGMEIQGKEEFQEYYLDSYLKDQIKDINPVLK